MNLYELTENYRQLMEMADQLSPEALRDTLETIEDDINEKAENIAAVLRNMDGDINTLDNEIKRLQARKKSLETNQKSLRQYLQIHMDAAEKEQIKSARFTISVRNNAEKPIIRDSNLIPQQYYKEVKPVEPSVDVAKLKEARKNQEEIPGVEWETTRTVSIR